MLVDCPVFTSAEIFAKMPAGSFDALEMPLGQEVRMGSSPLSRMRSPDGTWLHVRATTIDWIMPKPGDDSQPFMTVSGVLAREDVPDKRVRLHLSLTARRKSFIPDLRCGQERITDIAEALGLKFAVAETGPARIEKGLGFTERLVRALCTAVRQSAQSWLPYFNMDLLKNGRTVFCSEGEIEAPGSEFHYSVNPAGFIRSVEVRRRSPSPNRLESGTQPEVGCPHDWNAGLDAHSGAPEAHAAGLQAPLSTDSKELVMDKQAESAARDAQTASEPHKQEEVPILIAASYEDRMKAKAMGLVWNREYQRWEAPKTMSGGDLAVAIAVFGTMNPHEAQARAEEARRVRRGQGAQRPAEASKSEAEAPQPAQEQAQEAQTQNRARSARPHILSGGQIPRYARLYLRPGYYSEAHRTSLKDRHAVWDNITRRWCIDRRLPTDAFASEIPDYRVVPIEEKDKARSLGAKWDAVQRSWYVPKGLEAELFASWPQLKDIPCRDYITVPRAEQAEARELGAVYDAAAKSYYIPFNADRSAFAKWSPSETEPVASRPIFRRRSEASAHTQGDDQSKGESERAQTLEHEQSRLRKRFP